MLPRQPGQRPSAHRTRGRRTGVIQHRDQPCLDTGVRLQDRIALTMGIYTQVPDEVTRATLKRLSDWLDHADEWVSPPTDL